MSETISEWFDNPEEAITIAETNASSRWEMDFMSDMVERYEQWGDDMYLSEKQHDVLERLCNG